VLPVPLVPDGRTIRRNQLIPAERAGTAIFIPVTNAIEALNSKLRRAVRARGHFPSDEAAMKLLFLVLNRAEKQWIMPPREWCMAKAQFAVLFGERFTRAMA
jgi:putative transposase